MVARRKHLALGRTDGQGEACRWSHPAMRVSAARCFVRHLPTPQPQPSAPIPPPQLIGSHIHVGDRYTSNDLTDGQVIPMGAGEVGAGMGFRPGGTRAAAAHQLQVVHALRPVAALGHAAPRAHQAADHNHHTSIAPFPLLFNAAMSM